MNKFMTIFAAASLSMAASAQAAVIDFVAEAANNERGIVDGTSIVFNGVNVTFNAGGNFAYFDDLSEGKPGGLGVCQNLAAGPGTECAISTDDNIQTAESVLLTFDQPYDLSGQSFSDQDHESLNANDTNTLLIAINDPNDFQQYTFAQAVGLMVAGVELIRYAYDESATGVAFYVNGLEMASLALEAPLPAAAPLLLFGLGGLGYAARRKRAQEPVNK